MIKHLLRLLKYARSSRSRREAGMEEGHCKGSGASFIPCRKEAKGYSASVIWLCFHYTLHLAIKQFETKFTKLAAETDSNWRRKLIEFMQVEHLHTYTHKQHIHMCNICIYITLTYIHPPLNTCYKAKVCWLQFLSLSLCFISNPSRRLFDGLKKAWQALKVI